MDYSTFYKRLAYGYTVAEALLIPKRMPRWMYAVEQEEGLSIIDVVKRERAAGVNNVQIAHSFEVNPATLYSWIRKWRRAGVL
jgi:transposase-like protein